MFPGSARAGNITISAHSVTYNFVVSASVMADQVMNEGEPSAASVRTTLFIPDPGSSVVLSPCSTLQLPTLSYRMYDI